jgi:hypothetical protein
MAKDWKAVAGRARSAWPFVRRCQVTVVSQVGQFRETTTTRDCGLPSVSAYLYVIAVVAILLLPDMRRVKVGGVEFERLVEAENS